MYHLEIQGEHAGQWNTEGYYETLASARSTKTEYDVNNVVTRIIKVMVDANPRHDTVTPVTDTASKETLIKSIERPDDMLSYRATDSLERIEEYRLMNIAARTPMPRKVDMDGRYGHRPKNCGLAYTHYIGTSHTESAGIRCCDAVYILDYWYLPFGSMTMNPDA